jgi:predicted ATPase
VPPSRRSLAGVWWIELAPLAPGADVTATVAVALGVGAPAGDALAGAVADAIGARRTMLVLDNCEHVVESCAPLVDLLLRACPALIVVATSREALGGDGETVWQLPGLSHPALAPGQPRFDPRTEPRPVVDGAELSILEGYESVRLFVSRARAASPRFALTTHNAGAVRAICARLDGLPLALELAAANVGVLGVEQIAARLDDAFAVLTRGRRTALPRHRTLGALLDWSHDLLSDDERRLLARLSVFRAAVPLEAIEAVGGADAIDDVLGAFSGLVDHSLVDVGESEGEPRYRLLETVRQYAAARLRAAPDDERPREGGMPAGWPDWPT